MAKQQWNSKSFSNHIDPEKEEQLKRVKIGIFDFHINMLQNVEYESDRIEMILVWLCAAVEDQVNNILKIMSDINHGNKERNLRKKTEAIELIEDFHKQYEKLYILYENLREKVKKSVDGDDSSSAPDSDAESNYWNGGNDEVSQESETSDLEDTLTCLSGVTKIMNSEPGSPFDILRDLEIHGEKAGKTNQLLAEIRHLDAQVTGLRVEVSTLDAHKKRLEEQVEWRSIEAMEAQDTISRLEAQLMEMEAECKEQEDLFSSFRKQFEADKQIYTTRIAELETQVEGMQLELSSLKHQKSELQVGLLDETRHWSSKVESLIEHLGSLQQQLDTVNSCSAGLMLEIENKSEEISEYLVQIEALRNNLILREQQTEQEKQTLQLEVHDLQSEIESLSSTKSSLEEHVKQLNHEASQSSLERETLEKKVSELQRTIAMRENELLITMKSWEEGVGSLTSKLETSENERNRLQVELEASQTNKKLLQHELEKEKEHNKSQLEKIAKTNFHNVERKIEEMAVEFRKQFEDQYRILSRRIRVAEQLQAENKEWYRKTKESYEQENKDLKMMTARTATELKNVKDLTVTANELLGLIDSKTLKFKQCTAKFQSRIIKVSRGVDSVKQWAATKNKTVSHMKDDMDCLLVQLGDKEAEILASREKVCMLENKVGELEKIIEEKEDEMQVLTEQKREAIRQLCIWIDYHRGRSDYYKDLLIQESILTAS